MDYFIEIETVSKIIGYLGNAFALFFFLSPIIIMYKLIKGHEDVDKIPGILLASQWFNCTLWLIYGIYIEKDEVVICNVIGASLSLIYITIYILYRFERVAMKLLIILLTFGLMCGFFAGFYWGVSPIDHEITGLVAMIFNIILYGSPGQNLITVFKTGNHNLIPIVSSVVGFLCSSTWTVWGFLNTNKNVIIPNILGVLLSIIQILVWLYFSRKNKVEQTSDIEAVGDNARYEPFTKN